MTITFKFSLFPIVDKESIQFNQEEICPDGGVPFLDVYCNTIDTDLYLNWNSNHPVSAKLMVVRT